LLHRERLAVLADGLAAAVAVVIPWSTSATGIVVALWLVALIPTLDVAALRRELSTAAGGIPVLFWLLGAVGMTWSDATLAERLDGLDSFHKFLAIPLLLAQFRRSGRGDWVMQGFFFSCTALLLASFVHAGLYDRVWHFGKFAGLPVRDYVLQSGEFELCAFGGAYVAVEAWRSGRRRLAAGLLILALLFVADIVYVVTGRTALAAMPVLLILFGMREFGWKGSAALVAGFAVLAAVVWFSSPYLRMRVSDVPDEVRLWRTQDANTSSGQRLEFWLKSARFIAEAPVIGHGTGTIRERFREAVEPGTGPSSIAAANPHQQIFAVGIQLGLVGIAVLFAFWVAHLWLFATASGLAAFAGLIVVAQNMVTSLFNSHLFDFAEGWLYVFGVGVLGGVVLRARGGAGSSTHDGWGTATSEPVP